ncbi:helicase C-terminal domain-containing protein [Dendryphion nanum]|uniref:ATP-dependent DNA helicase CHL1 n=1 Tax=Dendryphion nanum TaxID=256645 RepID=A0A9P9D9P8_9PLEO|nr:helicase C-terminal domain-containing protein [Dendryphion nanum]
MDRDFHHPYEPYDIQKQFMNAVYECLEQGKVGIFESPTGTGKSLSLICGSLTWLRDHKRQAFDDGFAVTTDDSDEPAWIREHARKQAKQAALDRRKELDDRIAKIKEREKRLKERYQNGEPLYKRMKGNLDTTLADDEAQFVLDDYDSDDNSNDATRSSSTRPLSSGFTAETQALMEQLGYADGPRKAKNEQVVDELKIFFCSRTHSQLTQFSNELRRVKMPPSIAPDVLAVDPDVNSLIEDVKHLTLGSRKNLCINSRVNTLRNATAINERCLELQQPGTASNCKCSFMPNKDNEVLVNEFRDHSLAKIRDIEELGSLGKKLGICPYYASRPATKYCEIVTLPYPLLLQKSAREALDLSLNGHVVIVDEAHNLMDAIVGIHSLSVTLTQVQQARAQLTVYLQRFRNKLKGKNRVYVAQIIRILDSIVSYLQQQNATPMPIDGIVDMSHLMSGKGVDQINLYKLNRYLQESRLARKVDGYTNFADQSTKPTEGRPKDPTKRPKHEVPVLTQVQGFLLSLMNPSAEGRFFFSKEDAPNIALKYLLLDPTFHFKDIVEDARAVVLAGGTMSPMSDYEQHLLSYLQPSKIMTLSCGHVIPPSSLLAVPVIKTLSGAEFDFTFAKRNSEKMMIDLGHAILGVTQHIPDGVVVFFPSYSYLDTCIAAWKRLRPVASANSSSFWDTLRQIKPIFLEQRSRDKQETNSASRDMVVDSVLGSYANAIASGGGRGALLFAVIGGTLSEGINFSDALGRGVVVVGLPFPNPHSAEWKAKTQYISAKATDAGLDGKAAARDFYENVCMRAVNQCVGRAIRHRNDYAAILMLDRRYNGPRIQAKLPQWIRGSLANGAGVGDVERCLDEFFAGKHI